MDNNTKLPADVVNQLNIIFRIKALCQREDGIQIRTTNAFASGKDIHTAQKLLNACDFEIIADEYGFLIFNFIIA